MHISPVRTREFIKDLESTFRREDPSESLDRVGVVEAQIHALAALQRDLAIDHVHSQIARRLELPCDDVQPFVALVATLLEADLAVVLREPDTRQRSEREALADGRLPGCERRSVIVNLRVHDQTVVLP